MRRYIPERICGYALSTLFVFLSACAASSAQPARCDADLPRCEEELGTAEKSLAIYHHVVSHPHGKNARLEYEGFLIGIEKAETARIGTEPGLDRGRFDMPESWRNKGRVQHLTRVTNDKKKMFVSHLTAYDPAPGGTRLRFLYSAYPLIGLTAAPDSKCPPIGRDASLYERGWKALEVLACELGEKFRRAHADGKTYSHLVVISMGWNNDQEESIWRFNRIMANLHLAAGEGAPFRPLVVAVSWPSVWFSEADWAIVKGIAHLISYGNKSDDADEIGYTYANHVVNVIARGLKTGRSFPPPRVVLIGHSMGARLLSRAAFSAPLLIDDRAARLPKADLLLGLQGAFSVNRFVDGHRLRFPLSLFRYGEGYPYRDYADAVGRVVLTWSGKDRANPVAARVTGAKHAGGEEGFEESMEKDKRGNFLQIVVGDGQQKIWKRRRPDGTGGEALTCGAMAGEKKVLMVDATAFVKGINMAGKEGKMEKLSGHNDILDDEMGRFLWGAIRCFADFRE